MVGHATELGSESMKYVNGPRKNRAKRLDMDLDGLHFIRYTEWLDWLFKLSKLKEDGDHLFFFLTRLHIHIYIYIYIYIYSS